MRDVRRIAEEIVAREGGYVNDRDDPGGATKYGVTIGTMRRPMMALGTLGLFVAAMVDPIWFASRMQGIALVPEPLWWLLGAIVSFYFGARHQAKGQEFRRSVAETMAQAGAVAGNIHALEALERGAGAETPASRPAEAPADAAPNPALDEWRAGHG